MNRLIPSSSQHALPTIPSSGRIDEIESQDASGTYSDFLPGLPLGNVERL